MAVLNELEPKEVFRFFEEISAIPRGSRDTKRISDYLVAFAKERDLKVIQDEVNNVIIFQPGTPGYEESEPVILQGHMDMVCEKTSESTHDFENDGLELYVEDLHCWIAERFHIRQLRQYLPWTKNLEWKVRKLST